MYTIIGLWIAGGLLALGIIAILFSGIRGMIMGSVDLRKILMFLIPFVAYGVAYLLTHDFVKAGISTMVFMLATMVLGIFFTGFRSTFNL